ncbi:MAG: M20/M25/M40 family metallo-hydrolase, partial [Bdellovibrionota bacterium]
MKYFLVCSFVTLAASQPLFASENIVDAVLGPKTKNYEHLEAFYQDLHRHPELSLKETRTAGKVAEEFKRLGFETLDNVGGGVVGILRNGAGPVTLVRSELDGLPVTENTRVKFQSENPGVMHACAHDFHTTALLGTAEVMVHEKDKWKGTLVFVAQPAEEVVKGAQAMVDAGLFKKIPHPDQCLAL